MPKLKITEVFLPLVESPKRFNVLIGGRGSAKSWTIADLLVMLCVTERADVLCGREYQNSIADSVHKLIVNTIKIRGIEWAFSITDKRIDCLDGGGFRFRGFARNPDAVKSAEDFKYCWVEEAQTLSSASIRDLLPTIRKPGSRFFFSAWGYTPALLQAS